MTGASASRLRAVQERLEAPFKECNPSVRRAQGLKRARKLISEAFGADAKEMIHVEIALIDSVPPARALSYLNDALSLARTHHEGNTEFIADLTPASVDSALGVKGSPLGAHIG